MSNAKSDKATNGAERHFTRQDRLADRARRSGFHVTHATRERVQDVDFDAATLTFGVL